MLIFSEDKQYENLMQNGFEKYPNSRDLKILCSKWLENGIPYEDLKENIINFCRNWNKEFVYSKSEQLILNVLNFIKENNCNKIFNYCTKIEIYQNEIDTIKSLPNFETQKIAFIMICLAKWRNADFIYINSGGSIKIKDIFDFAKVKATKKEQLELLHELCKCEFIDVQLKPLLKLFLPCVKEKSNLAFTFDINETMIKQWELLTLPKCVNCGEPYKKNNNKQKYCKECATLIKNQQKLKYWNSRKIEKTN